MAKISGAERLRIKRLVRELNSHRAPHTEFVTVYIPAGYNLDKINQHLSEEYGTASNIKSAVTRKNVQAALEKMLQHLKGFKRTPDNGLVAFAGNIAASEGKQDIRIWSFEPPIPLNQRIYRCDKVFVTDILEEILIEHEVYGLVVLDRRDATIALLKGKTIIPLQKTHSEVPGKTRAGGQCLVPNTLIQSCDGNLSAIKFSHNPQVVKSMLMKNSSLGNSPITDRWNVTKSCVYKITTTSPRLQVEASKDHIFFVRTNNEIVEKAAEELATGDYLIMPEKIDVKGEFQTINAVQYYNSFNISKEGQAVLKKAREKKSLLQRELAMLAGCTQTGISFYEIGKRNAKREFLQRVCAVLEIDYYYFLTEYTCPELYREVVLPVVIDPIFAQFLGYLIGDGCIERDRITFFEQRKELALEYKKLFDSYLKLNSSYKFRESKNYHQLRFTSRPLVRLIVSEFTEIKKTMDTLIPKKILQSPTSVVAGFLRGLFDAEGYCSKGRSVGLGINNKQLAHQIQMALLRFGIIASIHEYDNERNPYSDNPRFTIDITEKKSLELFEEEIGFSSQEKACKLHETINRKTQRSSVRQILTPGSKIRKLIEKAGYKQQLFPKVNNFFRDERMMSKQAFKESILKCVEDKKLRSELIKIYNSPFLPVKISSIDVREEETQMVDISVGNQNFIANGLIVHNSSQRFARIREGAAKDHFKKIADYMKEQFLPLGNNLKGIIVGGPGITVHDFMNKDYLTGEVKRKIIGTKDLSYTGEHGLQELLDRCSDLLAKEEVTQEKEVMQSFFELMNKDISKITYGEEQTMKALDMKAVDILLISEAVPEEKVDRFEEKAQESNAVIKVISTETREGVQLQQLGGIAAMLRFPLS